MPFWFKTQQSIVQICYFNSQRLIPITSQNAITDEKYTKYLWYKKLKVTSLFINGCSPNRPFFASRNRLELAQYIWATQDFRRKKNKKKFKFVSENLLLHSISQGQFMITPSQRSPSPPCDFPISIKSSSHLHFCDFIQRHVHSCHRYHSKVF